MTDMVLTAQEYEALKARIGRLHLKQRLGIERDSETRVFGQGLNFFHIENWYSVHSLIRNGLRVTGLYERGRRNGLAIGIRHHEVRVRDLPEGLDGYSILQLSDVHLDMNGDITAAIIGAAAEADYDLCVITGDFRGLTYGPFDRAVNAAAELMQGLHGPVLAVLGNHDSIQMVPGLEQLGMRVLLNEHVCLQVNEQPLYIAGIDDPHYYCVDNIEKAAEAIPPEATSVLLSHSPEVYRRAAHSDFDLMLCGHTHGGQICLPGGFPLLTNARCSRRYCAGSWQYHDMTGYTSAGTGMSIVDVRFNCPAEITLHHLRAA